MGNPLFNSLYVGQRLILLKAEGRSDNMSPSESKSGRRHGLSSSCDDEGALP